MSISTTDAPEAAQSAAALTAKPADSEQLFRDAVLLVIGLAASPLSHREINAVTRLIESRDGHSCKLGKPEWPSRVVLALIELEDTDFVECESGRYSLATKGRTRVDAAAGCRKVRDEILEALGKVGLEAAK